MDLWQCKESLSVPRLSKSPIGSWGETTFFAMPRRRVNTTRKKRSTRVRLREECQFIGTVAPASSFAVSWSHIPERVSSATFRLVQVKLTAASLDVAVANSFKDGPAVFQIRQLHTDGKTTLRSSPALMVGTNSRTFHLRPDRIEYPGPWRGDNIVSVDCLCPHKGYERGMTVVLRLSFTHDHVPASDDCPTIECVPTNTLMPHSSSSAWKSTQSVS